MLSVGTRASCGAELRVAEWTRTSRLAPTGLFARDKLRLSSTPEATVGPSLVPAFLAEQQRRR